MKFREVNEVEAQLRLEASVSGLADKVPIVSAKRRLSIGQRKALLALAGLAVVGLCIQTVVTMQIIVGVITILYFVGIGYRVVLWRRSAGSDTVELVSMMRPERFQTMLFLLHHFDSGVS